MLLLLFVDGSSDIEEDDVSESNDVSIITAFLITMKSEDSKYW